MRKYANGRIPDKWTACNPRMHHLIAPVSVLWIFRATLKVGSRGKALFSGEEKGEGEYKLDYDEEKERFCDFCES